MCLNDLGVNADESICLGNLEEDMLMSRAVGVYPVLIGSFNFNNEEALCDCDIVESLGEFKEKYFDIRN